MFAKLSALLRAFGPGWLVFRLAYALRRRLGLLRLSHPAYRWADRPLSTWLIPGIPAEIDDYPRWRQANVPAFLFDPLPTLPPAPPWDWQSAVNEADAFLNGRLRFFSTLEIETGFPPDWACDPSTAAHLPLDRHWTNISDQVETDIKFVWEPARFSWAYTLSRAYAASRAERFAEGFWTVLEDWMERNPPNLGPGWMDGQECALRLSAACFAQAAFHGSPASTPQRIARFTCFAAALAARIRANLAYAVSTRSNHTVSEAFGLWLTGTLFPELKQAPDYRNLGQRILTAEAQRQLFPDGGYAMYSLNYQRFVLHLYCLALRLAELNQEPFPRAVYDRVAAAADFLYQLVDPQSGQMPEFGSNDGALVLPLNTCAYTDYRPLIQLCHYTAHRSRLFPPGPWDEDLFWLFGPNALALPTLPLPGQETRAFLDAGVYTLRSTHSAAILRCVDYRARPSHADQLHLDLWMRGENIAVDPGTFSYHAPDPWRNGLSGALHHNTVTVDARDPMTRLSRFTWGDWSRGKVLRREPGLWQGQQDGYQRLPDPVSQRRTALALPGERWLVVDVLRGLRGLRPHRYRLHWLLADSPYTPLADGSGLLLNAKSGPVLVRLGALATAGESSLVRADPHSPRGWRSRTYAQREPALSLALEVTAPQVCFWTLFGQPGDRVETSASFLTILTPSETISLDLNEFS